MTRPVKYDEMKARLFSKGEQLDYSDLDEDEIEAVEAILAEASQEYYPPDWGQPN